MLALRRASSLSGAVRSQLGAVGEVAQKRNASIYEHSLKYGQGGRLSFNGNVVTVFGATGFLGRYVVSRLAKCGTQLVIPYRASEDDVRHLRVMGDLGQIVFLEYDVRDYNSIVKTLSHSNCAINLVGRNFVTRNFSMKDVHVDATTSIAAAVAESQVDNLIHVSHLMADENSPSEFMRLKAIGEKAVLDKFPGATVMRSADAYGDEDKYLNKYAYMSSLPFVPLVNGGYQTYRRPVFIADLAQGIVNTVLDKSLAGKSYEIYGPEEYLQRNMVEFIFRLIKKKLRVVDIPLEWYANIGALMEQSFFFARLTRDQVIRQTLSDVVSSDAFTLADLGIDAVNLNDVAMSIYRMHRQSYMFEDPMKEEDYIQAVRY